MAPAASGKRQKMAGKREAREKWLIPSWIAMILRLVIETEYKNNVLRQILTKEVSCARFLGETEFRKIIF